MSGGSVEDPPTFEEWYGDVSDGLTRRISAAVGDPVLGRELAAEAFARAYDRWPRVAKMDSPSGWVYRTALNLAKRWWRRRAIERRALAKLSSGVIDGVHVPADSSIDDGVEVGGHRPDEMPDLVNELPDRMRTAVRLRYWEDLTEAQVAQRMKTSTGSVSATLSNARKRLAANLKKQT